MMRLSRRVAGECHRAGGIELMILWPAVLGPPPELGEGQECPVALAEAWLATYLDPELRQHDIRRGVSLCAYVRRPVTAVQRGGELTHHLAVRLVGGEYAGARASRETLAGAGTPPIYWYTDAGA